MPSFIGRAVQRLEVSTSALVHSLAFHAEVLPFLDPEPSRKLTRVVKKLPAGHRTVQGRQRYASFLNQSEREGADSLRVMFWTVADDQSCIGAGPG